MCCDRSSRARIGLYNIDKYVLEYILELTLRDVSWLQNHTTTIYVYSISWEAYDMLKALTSSESTNPAVFVLQYYKSDKLNFVVFANVSFFFNSC